MENNKLNPEQVDRWRKILVHTLGPYALLMPKEDVQKHRDSMQKQIDEFSDAFDKDFSKEKEA